jgi:hypothetical protein
LKKKAATKMPWQFNHDTKFAHFVKPGSTAEQISLWQAHLCGYSTLMNFLSIDSSQVSIHLLGYRSTGFQIL